jgi:Tfp pilus assembly protein PilZ
MAPSKAWQYSDLHVHGKIKINPKQMHPLRLGNTAIYMYMGKILNKTWLHYSIGSEQYLMVDILNIAINYLLTTLK